MIVGVIESFDDRRGDGHLRSDDGGDFYFHCVAIADGSRGISPGARVEARRSVGHLGHDEAVSVRALA